MKNLVNNLQNFFRTALGTHVIYYTLFYTMMWLFHLIIISIISYFHLILNHNIGTIADWIVDRGWLVIIFTKLSIFYLVMQFMKLKSKKFAFLKVMIRNSVQWPRHEIAVALIFLIAGLISLGNMSFNSTFIVDLLRPFYSIAGTFIFFGTDLFIMLALDVFFPIKNEKTIQYKIILFPILFYFYSRFTFIYEQNISLKLFAYFFILYYSSYWRRRNWTIPLLFIVSFLVPTYVIFGLDPIWGHTFSLFKSSKEISTFSIFILVGFACSYLEYHLRKNPEYIYRD
jgi:hypothetical protein